MTSLKLKIFMSRLKQKYFGRTVEIQKSWEDIPSDYEEMVDFLNWFDSTKSVEQTVDRGKTDWVYRFKKFNYFKALNRNTALEIGFGGGRLLLHAAADFDLVYGIDIHKNFELSKKFLISQNVNNFKLLNKKEIDKIPDSSIDFIYSFIVFQHFESISEIYFYLNHIKRLIGINGMAHIYYGKNEEVGIKQASSKDFRLRDCSLFVSPDYMKQIISNDFHLIDYKDELPRDPINNTGTSVQSMIVFKNKVIDTGV